MKIAVTGYKGRLGSALITHGCVPLECDITNPEQIDSAIQSVSPDVIINCAAFTAVDQCESDEAFKEALKVNFYGVENLVNTRIPMIHISTDYVFNGERGPYSEREKYNEPVNSYGYSKLAGEIVVLYPSDEKIPRIVVRTTGLFCNSAHHDFVKLVRGEYDKLYVASNLYGNQTNADLMAESLLILANKLPQVYKVHKIVHIASIDVVSRYEFSLMIASRFGLDKNKIIPVGSSKIEGWVAKRPRFGGLKTALSRRLKLPQFSIVDGLNRLSE